MTKNLIFLLYYIALVFRLQIARSGFEGFEVPPYVLNKSAERDRYTDGYAPLNAQPRVSVARRPSYKLEELS